MENAHLEEQVHAAKAFFLNTSDGDSSNLYDHLAECLGKILEERPDNALGKFEEISRSVKREKLSPRPDVIQDSQGISSRAEVATIQKPLFMTSQGEDGDAEFDDEVEVPFPNLMDIMSNFEQGGIGIGKDQTYRIFLALKQLTTQQPLASVRFWGIIFGIEASYIIAEGEYQEGHEEEEEEEEEEEAKQEDQDGDGEGKDNEEDSEEKDVLPESQWKPPPVIPKEETRMGTNKKVYFVCNTPGDKWVKLPHVKPAEIVAARCIRKLFTGNLESPVVGYPPFPGREEHLLRAQIGRISATTQISPAGYYTCEEEEDEGEDDAPKPIEVNSEFEMGKLSEYADGSMNNWSHHIQYILPQGRCQWFNPVPKADDEFDEDEEDEDKEQPEELEPETGPQILTAVAEDERVEGMPAWSARLSSSIIPQYAVALVSSNLWPGAHAYVSGKNNFENIYIGWGLKYSSTPFNPLLPPAVQDEFPTGADITETKDPTAEEEAALKAMQEEAEKAAEEEEEPEDSEDEG